MNTRVMILVGSLLALSAAAVIVGRHRAAGHVALKETAVQLIREGRSGEAIPLLKDAVAAKPDYAEAYHALGIAYGNIGEDAAAEACLKKAISLKPEYPKALYNLAAVCERQRRYDEALALLAEAEKMKGGAPGAPSARARILFSMGKDAAAAGDLAGAERLFSRAAKADPAFPDARYALGRLYQRQGKFKEAVAEFTLVTKMKPGAKIGPALRDSYAAIGDERARAGDHASSADAYRRAVLLDPENKALRYRYGVALVRQGEIDKGADEIAEARRTGGAVGEPDSKLAAALATEADGAIAAGEMEKAAGRLDLAARVDPGRDLSAERARLSVARGDRAVSSGDAAAAAVRFYREAERIRPDTPGLADKLAPALAAAGERDEAIRQYRRLLEREPGKTDLLMTLGGLHAEAGEFAKAAECYEAAGARGREPLLALYDRWASSEKDPAIAARLYRKCAELDPRNDRYLGEHALALARKGDCKGALGEIRALMKNYTRPPVPLLDPLRVRRLESVRLAKGAGNANGTHVWVFSLHGKESITLGELTVTGGKQKFDRGDAYTGEKPLALRILFKGPDTIGGESELDIRYDGGKEKRILCPVLRPSSVIFSDNDGFTWKSNFSVICRSTIPRGALPYQRWNHILGLICRRCGLAKEARECADYHCRWGHAYYSIGYDPEAEEELRWAVEIWPEHFQSRLLLSLLFFRQKRYDEAVAEIRRAAALKPDSAVPINDEGVILAAAGKYQEAEMLLLRAAGKDRRLITACRNLQTLYGKVGRSMEERFWKFQIDKMEESRDFYEDGLLL